jgi:uncharacterized protein YybS (DUF2232 family)
LNNGRKIAEGGALLALYTILLFITVQFPFIGFLTFFFLPVPFILVAIKQPLRWSFGFLFAACLLSFLFGTIFSIPMALITGLTGIAIGYLLKKEQSTIIIFIASVLVFLVGTLAFYGISVWFLKVNYIEESMNMLKASMDTSMEMLEAIGQSPTEEVRKSIYTTIDMVNNLLPSLFVVSSAIMVILIFLAAKPILKRFSDKSLKWPPFKDLTFPKSLLWYYLITMILALVVNQTDSSYFYMVISNVLFILQLCMLLQGYSFIFYWVYLKEWSKAMPIIIIAVSFLIPLLQSIIRLLGIIDLGFPLRQNIVKKK